MRAEWSESLGAGRLVGPPVDEGLVALAVELARTAGTRTLRWFNSPDLVVDRKGDGTPVTAADRDAESFLREQLQGRFPDDSVHGEEESDVEGTSGRTWIVDPIDGTKAFTQGVPLYCNLLAMHDEFGPAIGVINLPALGETVWAGRGRGCYLNGARVAVSSRSELDGSYVTASGFSAWPEQALLAVNRSGAHLRTWGDGYGYALVATGRAEAMVDFVAEAWDLAPIPVIIAEAGGAFSSLDGSFTHADGSGVATNGLLHGEILRVLTGD